MLSIFFEFVVRLPRYIVLVAGMANLCSFIFRQKKNLTFYMGLIFGNSQKLLMFQSSEWIDWWIWVIEFKKKKKERKSVIINNNNAIILMYYMYFLECLFLNQHHYLIVWPHMHAKQGFPNKKENIFKMQWMVEKNEQWGRDFGGLRRIKDLTDNNLIWYYLPG